MTVGKSGGGLYVWYDGSKMNQLGVQKSGHWDVGSNESRQNNSRELPRRQSCRHSTFFFFVAAFVLDSEYFVAMVDHPKRQNIYEVYQVYVMLCLLSRYPRYCTGCGHRVGSILASVLARCFFDARRPFSHRLYI